LARRLSPGDPLTCASQVSIVGHIPGEQATLCTTRPDYTTSHASPSKAASYDKAQAANPFTARMWRFEQRLLEWILQTYYSGTEIHCLDFACGTGRVTSWLEDRVTSCTAVDISAAMLAVAAKKLKHTRLIHADLINENVLPGETFNLITAFRFFPNAQPPLRKAAMRALVDRLSPSGYLVFNNHQNRSSPVNLVGQCLWGANVLTPPSRYFMSIADMRNLASRGGLNIVKFLPCALLFRRAIRTLPASWVDAIETATSQGPWVKHLARDVIAVCQPRRRS